MRESGILTTYRALAGLTGEVEHLAGAVCASEQRNTVAARVRLSRCLVMGTRSRESISAYLEGVAVAEVTAAAVAGSGGPLVTVAGVAAPCNERLCRNGDADGGDEQRREAHGDGR